jgi:hypothetical protein
MTLKYNGIKAQRVRVLQDNNDLIHDQLVEPGGFVTFTGSNQHDLIGNVARIHVGYRPHTEIVTDCSAGVYASSMYADFQVVEAHSLNGGRVCNANWGDDDCDDYEWQCKHDHTGFVADANTNYWIQLVSKYGACQFDNICLDFDETTDSASSDGSASSSSDWSVPHANKAQASAAAAAPASRASTSPLFIGVGVAAAALIVVGAFVAIRGRKPAAAVQADEIAA